MLDWDELVKISPILQLHQKAVVAAVYIVWDSKAESFRSEIVSPSSMSRGKVMALLVLPSSSKDLFMLLKPVSICFS